MMAIRNTLGLLLLIVMSAAGLGSVPLFDVDEAVFSQATKEMVEKKEWITPTYNDGPRYDKPILFYWLMALSYGVFGINEVGARFPSALSGVALILAVFAFTRRFAGHDKAFGAAMVCAVSILYFAYSHAAVTDMALTLFISLALFSFFIWSEREGRSAYLWGLYVFSALAFLTKGLVGILFPFGIAVLYRLGVSGVRGALRLVSLPGIVLFVAVSAPWYLAHYVINGDEFIRQFFVKHHFSRYTGVISGHKGPFYYYLPVLLIGIFPWSAYIGTGIREAVMRWRGGRRGPEARLGLFCLIWGLSVLIFFSFSTTKLPNYILPALPAFAVITAFGMTGEPRWLRISHGVAAVSGFVVSAGCLIGRPYLLRMGLRDDTWLYWCAAVFAAMGVAAAYGVLRRRALYGAYAALMLVFFGIVSVKALPVVHEHLQGTLHRYSTIAGQRTPEGERIIAYRVNNPSILYYSGRRILNPYDREGLADAVRDARMPAIAITRSRDKGDLEMIGFRTLQDDGRYALLER